MDETEYIFDTPYDERDALNGQKCRVLRTIEVKHGDGTTTDSYRVVFEDGTAISAWPEELKEVQA